MILIVSALLMSCSDRKDKNPASPPPTAVAPSDDTVFDTVDIMPEFAGGNKALIQYLSDNIKYPEEAKANNTMGKVLISFVVEKDGSVDNVKVVRGIDPNLDSEALRVVRSLPDFEKPGIKNGKEVAVNYMVPINFMLDSKK